MAGSRPRRPAPARPVLIDDASIRRRALGLSLQLDARPPGLAGNARRRAEGKARGGGTLGDGAAATHRAPCGPPWRAGAGFPVVGLAPALVAGPPWPPASPAAGRRVGAGSALAAAAGRVWFARAPWRRCGGACAANRGGVADSSTTTGRRLGEGAEQLLRWQRSPAPRRSGQLAEVTDTGGRRPRDERVSKRVDAATVWRAAVTNDFRGAQRGTGRGVPNRGPGGGVARTP